MSAKSNHVARFRQCVYEARDVLTPGCQVLLLRLSEDMNANGIVSVPRSKLAAEFDCPPARITEWVNQAKKEQFLSVVRRGRPGTTAVYQGLRHEQLVRQGVPSGGTPGRTSLGTDHETKQVVRQGVPENGPAWYAQHVPQEGVGPEGIVKDPAHRRGDVGSYDEQSDGSASAASARSAS